MADKGYYMTNCVTRIMRAPCEVRWMHQRDVDVSMAIEIAAKSGIEAAHQYLIQLCNEAENGKYTPVIESIPVLPVVLIENDGRVIVSWR
jgi:hypothetical protein